MVSAVIEEAFYENHDYRAHRLSGWNDARSRANQSPSASSSKADERPGTRPEDRSTIRAAADSAGRHRRAAVARGIAVFE
jgi:hypothetical protein